MGKMSIGNCLCLPQCVWTCIHEGLLYSHQNSSRICQPGRQHHHVLFCTVMPILAFFFYLQTQAIIILLSWQPDCCHGHNHPSQSMQPSPGWSRVLWSRLLHSALELNKWTGCQNLVCSLCQWHGKWRSWLLQRSQQMEGNVQEGGLVFPILINGYEWRYSIPKT